MNRLSEKKRLGVLHLLIEGNSIRSTSRLTGVHKCTIAKHLVAAGQHCQQLLDRQMRNLRLEHLQIDEIWTFVYCKQKRIPFVQKSAHRIGDQYLFIAIDESTKLVPAFSVGKREGTTTYWFLRDLYDRLVLPDNLKPEDRTQISTDGYGPYPDCIDTIFAKSVRYGQIIKAYHETEQPGRYAPPKIAKADRRPIWGAIRVDTICTSHVERNNLTIRTFMRRFTRLSLGFSKKLENLIAAVALHLAHYNFCRRHGSLRVTPAMAAGVTNRLWSLEELLTT